MDERRRLPAWFLGLIIALVVFALFMLATSWLGVGDDPGVEGSALFRP